MIDGFRVQITLAARRGSRLRGAGQPARDADELGLTNTLIDLYCGTPTRDWNAYFRKIVADDARRTPKGARGPRQGPQSEREAVACPQQSTLEPTHIRPSAKAIVTDKKGQLTLDHGSFTCPLDPYQGDTFRITNGFFENQLVAFRAGGWEIHSVKVPGSGLSA